jgi:hypothetical protein
MAYRIIPDRETLTRLLRYEPETGLLFWRERPVEMFIGGKYPAKRRASSWNSRCAGKQIYCINKAGYIVIRLSSEIHLIHRVIWKFIYDIEPIIIDHIDGNRTNNRLNNLRSIDIIESNHNLGLQERNTSDYTGIHWDEHRKKWKVEIGYKNKNIYIGRFTNKQDAIAARKQAETEYGYHPNHGRPRN